jgi:hypothetical protein
VSGLADGPHTLTAPITRKSCFYYQTRLWRWEKSEKGGGRWASVADERLHIPFFLEDKTGKILVDPTGAELELHKDFEGEYQASFFNLLPGFTDKQAQLFIASYGLSDSDRVKIQESCIKPKNALFILGSVAENHGVRLTSVARRENPSLTSRLPVPGLFQGSLGNISAVAMALREATQTNVAVAEQEAKEAQADADVQNPHYGTEQLVLMKGTARPDFLISWRSRRDVLGHLAMRSTLSIWGGPLLTVACVLGILVRLHVL